MISHKIQKTRSKILPLFVAFSELETLTTTLEFHPSGLLESEIIETFFFVTGTHEMSKTASPQVSRPLKSRAMGMISGVATNLKSRLSQFNSSGSSLSPGNQSSQHHQSDGSKVVSALHSPARSSTSSGSESAGPLAAASSSLSNHVIKRHSLGEQPASVIPLTVPGADSTMPSFPYGKHFY